MSLPLRLAVGGGLGVLAAAELELLLLETLVGPVLAVLADELDGVFQAGVRATSHGGGALCQAQGAVGAGDAVLAGGSEVPGGVPLGQLAVRTDAVFFGDRGVGVADFAGFPTVYGTQSRFLLQPRLAF